MANKTNSQDANYSIPQNSAGYVAAKSINKKNPAPVKTTGKDLRSGK
ncbi:MAG: hypothetical protein Q8911_00485 [Bacillota bacterium]|nr:hypothetical protein [Bacillota bacterium]